MSLPSATLLRLMAWLSPSFPVGAFSYSHGLEYAVESGLVRDLPTTVDWITTVLLHGSGRIDADLFVQAHGIASGLQAAGDDPAALDEISILADAWRGTPELALESSAQGNAFVLAVDAAWPDRFWSRWRSHLKADRRQPAYAVAVAVAAARADIPLPTALAAFLHAFAANLVSAAVRLIPLGQSDGQRAIAALEAMVLHATDAAMARPPEDRGGGLPMLDWCSISHETQYTRLFRS
ncbi:urease accessory protein UreF [Insolitispirillum peregrinum]|uniref:urease accessory protein UreF n=1 Tax=Insolitispirillum peregrinum TaxID=80876 RepID=UPI00361F474F